MLMSHYLGICMQDENIRSLTAQLVILEQHAQAGEAVAHMEVGYHHHSLLVHY
jgi:hypothetical protein